MNSAFNRSAGERFRCNDTIIRLSINLSYAKILLKSRTTIFLVKEQSSTRKPTDQPQSFLFFDKHLSGRPSTKFPYDRLELGLIMKPSHRKCSQAWTIKANIELIVCTTIVSILCRQRNWKYSVHRIYNNNLKSLGWRVRTVVNYNLMSTIWPEVL